MKKQVILSLLREWKNLEDLTSIIFQNQKYVEKRV